MRARGLCSPSPRRPCALRGGVGGGGISASQTANESAEASPHPRPLPAPRLARGWEGSLYSRHCEERLRRSNPEKQSRIVSRRDSGLLRGACQRAGVRPTRWLAMTGQESTISRRRAPEFCKNSFNSFTPSRLQWRGRRECRMLDAPASFACNKRKTHAQSQGPPETNGIPCAMVLTAPPWSPWCTGLVSHHHLRELRPAS